MQVPEQMSGYQPRSPREETKAPAKGLDLAAKRRDRSQESSAKRITSFGNEMVPSANTQWILVVSRGDF